MTRHRVRAAALAVAALALTATTGAGTASAAARPAAVGDNCMQAATDAYTGNPWPQRLMAPDRVWMLSRGASITVAVLDTGVSSAAPALAGKVLPGVDLARNRHLANEDCDGHGTFVAGLLVASRVGGSGLRGIAPDAKVLPIRVVDQFQDVDPDVLARGVEAATDRGAQVIAVVPSAPFGSSRLAAAVRAAQRHGSLVVATAGSERGKDGDVAYPAALPGVLAVNAVGADGKPAGLAPRDSAALAAPGGDVVGIAPSGRGNRVATSRSFATAFVAGAAALVRSYHPELKPDQVAARLVSTADPALGGAAVGAGTLNPVSAVTTVMPMRLERPSPPAHAPVSVALPAVAAGPPGDLALLWVALAALGAAVAGVIGDSIVRARRRIAGPAPIAPEGSRRA